jgi:hypothetical protein
MQHFPLVPEDRRADPALHRRSFVRAATAMMLARKGAVRAEALLAKAFPADAGALRVLKAAQSPTSTADFPAMVATRVLPMLMPQAASGRLLAAATSVDLAGISSISLPYIGKNGRPAVVPFVVEGGVMPVVNLLTSSIKVGPVKKMLIGAALTNELQSATANTAADVISSALAVSAEQSIDALLFSASAATAAAPAGILNGISGITGTAGGGMTSIVTDLSALANAIAGNGIAVDGMTIITTPTLATKLRALVSPRFDNEVLSSSSIASGVVIAIAAGGLVSAYDGSIQIEIADAPAIHFEDTAPTDISVAGSPPTVAFPARSIWQTDALALKVRGEVAWAVHPGAVAWISGAVW